MDIAKIKRSEKISAFGRWCVTLLGWIQNKAYEAEIKSLREGQAEILAAHKKATEDNVEKLRELRTSKEIEIKRLKDELSIARDSVELLQEVVEREHQRLRTETSILVHQEAAAELPSG